MTTDDPRLPRKQFTDPVTVLGLTLDALIHAVAYHDQHHPHMRGMTECDQCGHTTDAHRFPGGCAYVYNGNEDRCECRGEPDA
jgi:hypothetical protein